MLDFLRVKVKDDKKVLLYRDERLIKVLNAGSHKVGNIFNRFKFRFEEIDGSKSGIEGKRAEILYRNYPTVVERYFHVVELKDNQRAFVFINGSFKEFMDLGELKLYWKELNIQVEKVNVKENYLLDDKYSTLIEEFKVTPSGVSKELISEYEEGFLYLNGRYVGKLEPKRYYFFTELNSVSVTKIDKRVQEMEILSQEILSKDKATLRCNITMHYRVVDGERLISSINKPMDFLYKQLQFATREYLGVLSLDEILSKKDDVTDLKESLSRELAEFGVEIVGVHIKDIILPGEIRDIFNQVIEATKQAEANNIKRREETASTRSLLNTAKLMRDNPTLARLKELEILERISENIETLNIYGGTEALMSRVVELTPKQK